MIGGQMFSLLLTLIAVPVVHSLFEQAGEWLARRRKRNATDLGEAELAALDVEQAPLARSVGTSH